MKEAFKLSANSAYLPEFLIRFLIGPDPNEHLRGDPSIVDLRKRRDATFLYEHLEGDGKGDLLAGVQREDPQFVPTIILGGQYSPPQHATYDLICPTDNPNAMDQLSAGFKDLTCAIRGLRLEFGANAVQPVQLNYIKNGVAREQTLSAIELATNPLNTAAETEVFRAIGANSNIAQLSVEGPLAAGHRGHRLGVIAALSNSSLKNVAIKADEASCLRMLDWAADAGDPSGKNLRVELKPMFQHTAAARKTEALGKWNAAVVRLAESGTTKCLFLPEEIEQGLTPETRQAVQAAGMFVFAI
jgi:hypothetical protein